MDFIEACRRLIAVDSSPHAGSVAVITEAARLCSELGLVVDIDPYTYNGLDQANLIVRWESPGDKEELILQSHLDTPDPGPYSLWEKTGQNPFSATIFENKLYGLGAADCKADFVCKLQAMLDIGPQANWRVPPVLVATSGEELGLVGILKLLRRNKLRAQKALVGDPTQLNFVHAAKGYVGVEIQMPFSDAEMKYRQSHDLLESSSTQSKMFRGKAAHSGNPNLGENAIEKMFAYLGQLPEGVALMDMEGGTSANTVPGVAMVEFDITPNMGQSALSQLKKLVKALDLLQRSFKEYGDERFDPPHPTLNVGYVKSFADYVLVSGSCRIPPIVPQEAYEHWIKELSDACSSMGATFRVVNYIRPFATDPSSELVTSCMELAEELGWHPELVAQASTNESSVLSRKGISSISFGPGAREGNSYTAQEHVDLDDLQLARKFYANCIRKFCL